MKFRKTISVLGALAGAAAIYGGWLAYLAWRDLVTLDVRNMDVRLVVKKIERQTWESISVDKNVDGKVTLNVTRKPLAQVLRMISEQTFSRPAVLYPLYSNDRSLTVLREALRGEADAATQGWKSLQARGPMGGGPMMFMGPMFGGGGGFPGPNPVQSAPRVSLNLVQKDVAFAVLAFGRFAQARVVPEDGTSALITLTLNNATVPRAVAQLAKKAQRKWTTLYALQPGFGGPGQPGGPQFAEGGGERMRFGDGPRFGPDAAPMTDEKRDEMRRQREALEDELKQALPAAERQKLEAAQQERERQMQEFANMTDEQRRDRMMQMGGRNMAQMNRERLMNSTPEQRAQMSQRMNQMRAGGGPGGPGGPGGFNGPGGPGGPPR